MRNGVRTTEVMIAFRAGCTEGIGILEEAFPFLRVLPLGVCYSEPIPDTGIDLGHLRFLNDFDVTLGAAWLLGVGRNHERPCGVVRTAASGGPYLSRNELRDLHRMIADKRTTKRLVFGSSPRSFNDLARRSRTKSFSCAAYSHPMSERSASIL